MNQVETLDTAAASRRTGVSESTLQKWRGTGAGPAYFKLGRLVRYDGNDLIEWMGSRRIRSTSETVAN